MIRPLIPAWFQGQPHDTLTPASTSKTEMPQFAKARFSLIYTQVLEYANWY
jgi:hypothetical protein